MLMEESGQMRGELICGGVGLAEGRLWKQKKFLETSVQQAVRKRDNSNLGYMACGAF